MDLFFLRALVRGKLMTTNHFEQLLEQTRENAQRYRRVEKTDKLKEYRELEKIVSQPDFQAKKKELQGIVYEQTPEAKALEQFHALTKDKYVRKFMEDGSNAGRSSVQRYLELKAQTETPEFHNRVAFLANAHRWDTTEEGKIDARFLELQEDPDIAFFLNANVKAIEHYEQFELAFEDNFEWSGLKNSAWQAGWLYPNDKFVAVHSYTNERQAFNYGRNIETIDGRLYLRTRKETVEQPAWDATKGMVQKKFDYTSDAISLDNYPIREGSVIQVKCRCRGALNHGIYLRSKMHIPFISLFDYTGFDLFCGVKDSLKHDRHLKKLDGLQPIAYTVFTVSWQKDEIVWFVNNLEVYRTKNLIPAGEELFMSMYSFQFEKSRHMSEGSLEVDWVRIFNLKK